MYIKKFSTIAAAAAAVIVFSAGAAFALNLMDLHNSPLLSLLALQKAAQKHDTAAFQQHIDLDRFIGVVYDDGLAAVTDSGNSVFVTYSAKTGIYKVIRPYVIPFAKSRVLDDIADNGKKTAAPASQPQGKVGAFMSEFNTKMKETANRINPANLLKETIDFDNCEIKKVATHKKTKTEAIVAATIYDTKLKENFILRLKLAPLAGGGWKVMEPINFKDYAMQVDRAKKSHK